MANFMWRVSANSNSYRSLAKPDIDPGVFLNLNELFREGELVGDNWDPPYLHLWDYEGDESKPIGFFPSFPGFFIIDSTALEILRPSIQPTILEELPLPASVEGLSVLNLEMVDCIDHSKSEFKYFSSGRIMRVENYAFVRQKLNGKHLFRLQEESFTKAFADDIFKTAIEENELGGLLFYPLNQIEDG